MLIMQKNFIPSRKTINLFKIKKEDKQYDIKILFYKKYKK